MKLGCAGEPHLTYCTNIHSGETWAEIYYISSSYHRNRLSTQGKAAYI